MAVVNQLYQTVSVGTLVLALFFSALTPELLQGPKLDTVMLAWGGSYTYHQPSPLTLWLPYMVDVALHLAEGTQDLSRLVIYFVIFLGNQWNSSGKFLGGEVVCFLGVGCLGFSCSFRVGFFVCSGRGCCCMVLGCLFVLVFLIGWFWVF